MKPGDLPEPEHNNRDPCSHVSRPCISIDETQQSTKEWTQPYMDPPAVAKQSLF